MERNNQSSNQLSCNKTVKIAGYGKLRYLSKRAMKKKHPDGDYSVIGAIGAGLVNPEGQFIYEGETRFYYHPKQSYVWYRTLGYVPIQDGQYFSVVKKTNRVWILLLMAVVLVFTGMLLYFGKQRESWLDSSAVDYTPPERLNVETTENSIAIPGYQKIRVEAGTDTAYVVLWNPDSNPCYFRYILKAEDGEVLFESGLIPPGKAITEVQLSRKIPKGEHPISIEINSFSLDDHETPLNGAVLECKIIGIEP